MAKRKKADPAPAPKVETVPRYKYTGPNVPRLNFPALKFAFRPPLLTDNQVTVILDRYPAMIRYFEDRAATEQE